MHVVGFRYVVDCWQAMHVCLSLYSIPRLSLWMSCLSVTDRSSLERCLFFKFLASLMLLQSISLLLIHGHSSADICDRRDQWWFRARRCARHKQILVVLVPEEEVVLSSWDELHAAPSATEARVYAHGAPAWCLRSLPPDGVRLPTRLLVHVHVYHAGEESAYIF